MGSIAQKSPWCLSHAKRSLKSEAISYQKKHGHHMTHQSLGLSTQCPADWDSLKMAFIKFAEYVPDNLHDKLRKSCKIFQILLQGFVSHIHIQCSTKVSWCLKRGKYFCSYRSREFLLDQCILFCLAFVSVCCKSVYSVPQKSPVLLHELLLLLSTVCGPSGHLKGPFCVTARIYSSHLVGSALDSCCFMCRI